MKFVYGRYKGNNTIYYLSEVMACDTETSHNHDDNNPVCWVSSIQVYFNGQYKLFRKPSEFMHYLNEIINTYKLGFYRRLRIIFHNASYDLSYLLGFFQMYLPDKDDRVLLNDRHKIKSYRQGGIEVLDTYALSQCSLETWGKNLNVEHKKKVGMYDYNKLIYQDTELTEEEKEYDKYDVLCLYECFDKQLNNYGDTVATVPFTSTGYNRRTFRRNSQKDKNYRSIFVDSALNEESYDITVMGFSGGYTHKNRKKNGVIIGKIGHRDFRSHYPSIMRTRPMAFGRPVWTYDRTNPFDRNKTIKAKEICDLYPEYFSISVIVVTFAQLKDDNITMPFMQKSKMFNMHSQKLQLDNGRILKFEGYAEMVIDNLTLEILLEQYDIQGVICKVLSFKTMYMPECLAVTIDQFFKAKSDEKIKLKQYEKEYGLFDNRTIEQEDVLRRSKGGLNGCYGMFVQKPTHEEYNVDYDQIDFVEDIFNPLMKQKPVQEQLDKYYHSRMNFLAYQCGVTVTATAKYELYQYLKAIGYDKVLYADTDSLFYLKDEETEKAIEELNKKHHEQAEKLGAFIEDVNGKKIYYDSFDTEQDCKAFKALHAKCYGMIIEEEKNGKKIDVLKATIAGVPARTIIHMDGESPVYLTREEELGGITPEMKINGCDSFDQYKALDQISDDFIFTTNTGTCSNYITQKVHIEIVNGHEVETCGGCIIRKLDSKKITDIDNENVEFEVVKGELI